MLQKHVEPFCVTLQSKRTNALSKIIAHGIFQSSQYMRESNLFHNQNDSPFSDDQQCLPLVRTYFSIPKLITS